MARFLAGAAACFLFVTGAFLLWQGRAQDSPVLPEAPHLDAAVAYVAAELGEIAAPM